MVGGAQADPMTLLLAPSHRTYLGYVEQLARQPVLATPDAVCVQRIILHSIPRVGAQGCFPGTHPSASLTSFLPTYYLPTSIGPTD